MALPFQRHAEACDLLWPINCCWTATGVVPILCFGLWPSGNCRKDPSQLRSRRTSPPPSVKNAMKKQVDGTVFGLGQKFLEVSNLLLIQRMLGAEFQLRLFNLQLAHQVTLNRLELHGWGVQKVANFPSQSLRTLLLSFRTPNGFTFCGQPNVSNNSNQHTPLTNYQVCRRFCGGLALIELLWCYFGTHEENAGIAICQLCQGHLCHGGQFTWP